MSAKDAIAKAMMKKKADDCYAEGGEVEDKKPSILSNIMNAFSDKPDNKAWIENAKESYKSNRKENDEKKARGEQVQGWAKGGLVDDVSDIMEDEDDELFPHFDEGGEVSKEDEKAVKRKALAQLISKAYKAHQKLAD